MHSAIPRSAFAAAAAAYYGGLAEVGEDEDETLSVLSRG